MIYNRLEQFEILKVINITNIMIYVIIILGIIKMIIEKKSMRIIYKKISELEESVLKEIKGYKILIIGIMIMILISNIIGLIPYSYTITSHFIITIG
jgi:hypothetical protein